MRVENLHLTLLFLGDVAPHRLEALSLAAQEVKGEPFTLSLDVARYWGHNHLVYAVPHAVPPQLLQLVQGLERNLRKHRFAFDERAYKPHLTLLRHAQWNDAPLPQVSRVAWRAREFVLAQSERTEEGACYRVLAAFPLG
jgi:2'-5' RNA ligase